MSELLPHFLSFFLIFLAQTTVVTLDTVRLVLVTKGYKKFAPLVGFVGVLIWVVAIGFIMQHLDRWENILGYALGFANGNYVGMWLEEKLAMGYVSVRLVTKRDATKLIESLRQHGYGFSHTKAIGNSGKVSIIYCIIKRANFQKLITLVKKFNPGAFYTISDLKSVKSDVFSIEQPAINVPGVRV